jgi:hypothetical protein
MESYDLIKNAETKVSKRIKFYRTRSNKILHEFMQDFCILMVNYREESRRKEVDF